MPGSETVEEAALPYPPSWVNRLTAKIDRLPLPAWIVYFALGTALTLLLIAVAWTGGVFGAGASVLNFVRSGMTFAYLLALIHYLDRSAAAALARFRPVLTLNETGYEWLRYQLTTLPAGPALLASALGVVYGLLTIAINIGTAASRGMMNTTPVVLVLDVGFSLLIYTLLGVVVYHTMHQLRLVNAIYTEHTRIELFQQRPLYALSGLTARTAIGLGIPSYVWFQTRLTTPATSTAADIFQLVLWSAIIVVTFVWPLWGAHTLLEAEKQRLQDDVGRRIQSTAAALHSHVDRGELGGTDEIKNTLDALVTEQGVIDKLRTWPWRAETANGLVLAFLLPIVIWVVQRVLERFGF